MCTPSHGMGTTGFEPVTYGITIRCSNQLSYVPEKSYGILPRSDLSVNTHQSISYTRRRSSTTAETSASGETA